MKVSSLTNITYVVHDTLSCNIISTCCRIVSYNGYVEPDQIIKVIQASYFLRIHGHPSQENMGF